MLNNKIIYLASQNQGKVKEFQAFFAPYGYQVKSLLDLPPLTIEETGLTFEENALIKAHTLAKTFGVNALADDSGLEVFALDGAPGIYSARYSGKEKDDQANNEKLLAELKQIPLKKRGAQFVCALAYVTNDLKEVVVKGTVQGMILNEPRGNQGFGYDPLFYYPPYEKTFAELTTEEKAQISHRGKALNELKQVLFGD